MSNQLSTHTVTYEVAGNEIKLSPQIVHQFITSGNGEITMSEAVNFINLCRYSGINPFLKEAYLIKYGNQPAQMVVAKDFLLKRASRQSDYKGITEGIVVITKDGDVVHKRGTLVYPNETLIGGWAEVKRESYADPIYAEVAMDEYDTGKSTWKKMPANMINKVAQNKALRTAYPDELGSLYTDEEPSVRELDHASATDNQGNLVTFDHVERVEEPTQTIEQRITELRRYVRTNVKKYNTNAKVDQAVAEKNNVDDISILRDEIIVATLDQWVKQIKRDQEKAEQKEEVVEVKDVTETAEKFSEKS